MLWTYNNVLIIAGSMIRAPLSSSLVYIRCFFLYSTVWFLIVNFFHDFFPFAIDFQHYYFIFYFFLFCFLFFSFFGMEFLFCFISLLLFSYRFIYKNVTELNHNKNNNEKLLSKIYSRHLLVASSDNMNRR